MFSNKNKHQRGYRPTANYRNESNSQQKNIKHKSDFSSLIFESGRSNCSMKLDSLCSGSPRINQKAQFLQKYQTYMQFISSGKVVPQLLPKKNSYISSKKGAVTPTPKKTSPAIYQRGRHSAMDKFYNPSASIKQMIRIQKKSSNLKNNNLFIKGKIIKNEKKQKNKNNQTIKNKRQNIKSKSKNDTIKSSIQHTKDIDAQEDKLMIKLFKGIQFYRDLGRGAHALVRSAVDWNKKRKIAVKVYQKSELTNQQLQSIQRQIEILMSLTHVNIVKLYQIIETYKTINLMMEYGGGNSLEQYIKSRPEGRLCQKEAKEIFRQVLKAVSYLHEMNIAHRDLKTENILLNKHLQLKIIDFGFSLICLPDKTISSYCGTPTYMAPQVVSKTPHNPQYSDLWSLGILLFTMLNGQCPFKAATQKQLFKKITEGSYQYYTEISVQAQDLITKFLRKNPLDRCLPLDALKSKWFS